MAIKKTKNTTKKSAVKKKTAKKKAAKKKRPQLSTPIPDDDDGGRTVVGRPTKYKPEYGGMLIDYIQSYEPFYDLPVQETSKDGETTIKMKRIANPPPSLIKFAHDVIGVSRATLYVWAGRHREFLDSIKTYEEKFEDILSENTLSGSYNAQFAVFMAKNRIGWKDRQDHTSGDKPIKPGATVAAFVNLQDDELISMIEGITSKIQGPPIYDDN